MEKYRALSIVFTTLAILLSDIMCAVVSFNYCDMLWGAKTAGYSAPASTAFIYAIPYIVGIIICIALTLFFYKKQAQTKNV